MIQLPLYRARHAVFHKTMPGFTRDELKDELLALSVRASLVEELKIADQVERIAREYRFG